MATQTGIVYMKIEALETAVYSRAVKSSMNSTANRLPLNRPGSSEPSRIESLRRMTNANRTTGSKAQADRKPA